MSYLGYYKVGEQVFTNKIDAVLQANRKLEDITWNFNDEMFSRVNWQLEPSLPLKELYRLRAKQIREKFDYIVLLSSGGADSTNVIYSFLNNGIDVDEVIASAPISGLSNLDNNSNDNRPENTYKETFLAQIPLMKELSDRFPSVKFTLNDYFDTMLNYKEDDWLLKSSDWIHPTTVARFNLEKFKHLRDIADSGKRLGIVYGVDKPNLIINNTGQLFTIFGDLAVNTPRNPFNREYPNVENVLFYYTPELPEMLVKQAHQVARWMYMPENSHVLKYLRNIDLLIPFDRNRVRQSYWERAIIPCIYQETARPVYQAHKSTRVFFAEHDGWFYEKHYDTRLYKMLDSDFRHFFKIVNPKYLNKSRTSLEPFLKKYYIGDVSDFKVQV